LQWEKEETREKKLLAKKDATNTQKKSGIYCFPEKFPGKNKNSWGPTTRKSPGDKESENWAEKTRGGSFPNAK